MTTGLQVGKSDPADLGLVPNLRPLNKIRASRQRRPQRTRQRATGTVKNLVILVQFTDLLGQKTTQEFENLFNQEGYNVGGAVGSVKDYYKEVSYNQLSLESTVTSWVTVNNGYAYYGGNDANGNDLRPDEMVSEALQKLEASGF